MKNRTVAKRYEKIYWCREHTIKKNKEQRGPVLFFCLIGGNCWRLFLFSVNRAPCVSRVFLAIVAVATITLFFCFALCLGDEKKDKKGVCVKESFFPLDQHGIYKPR